MCASSCLGQEAGTHKTEARPFLVTGLRFALGRKTTTPSWPPAGKDSPRPGIQTPPAPIGAGNDVRVAGSVHGFKVIRVDGWLFAGGGLQGRLEGPAVSLEIGRASCREGG